MKIRMQYNETPDRLTHRDWEIAFLGKAVDERGSKALEFINSNCKECIYFEYIPKEFKVVLNDNKYDKDDIDSHLKGIIDKKILIDSTTLDFAEILILTQSFKDIGIKELDISYVEPIKYKTKAKTTDILHKRDFELSESIIGYEAIPGHALLVTGEVLQKVVFLCGFEAERIDRAIEDSQIVGSNCSCIFGVPAFSPGWEMDSFDNNISIIKERKITGGINFCGATNPLSVIQTLDEIYKGLEEEEQMFIVPLATKPMSIGACLFLIEKSKSKVAVLYDHPNEITGRAIEISNWHLFNVTFY